LLTKNLLIATFAVALAAAGASAALPGNPKVGKALFEAHGCGSCHNLAAANAYSSSGAGPDLDHTRKTYNQIVLQVTNGGKGMTPYKGVLTPTQIQSVAAFVYLSAHTQ
jgi:mono/diheme cytochrome c family protein